VLGKAFHGLGVVLGQVLTDHRLERQAADSLQRPRIQRHQCSLGPLIDLRMRSILLSLKMSSHFSAIG
jgi:hypothetical protein